MTTGERSFAKTYLLADQIERNAIPKAPVLLFPEDNAIEVVGPVDFAWSQAKDRDGDGLTYRHYVWPIDVTPNNNMAELVNFDLKAESTFISRKIVELEKGKAYYWKVIAEDSKGGTVESEVRRFKMK